MPRKNHTTIVVDVESVTRLNNSVYGNPRFTLHTNKGTYTTSSDSMCNYSVTNMFSGRSRTGSKGITLVLTPAGRVCDFYKIIDGKEVRP